jgi:Transglycosylase SLT domain/SPOR domain
MNAKSRWLSALAVAALVAIRQPARADDAQPPPGDSVSDTLCATITSSATANKLPIGFFTRLIWKESSLRVDVTSPAGAQGIAQFMPGTAAARGLANPFDPDAALPEAAKFLAELSTQFGNLGLAAAAYNAGPTRLAHWLAGQGDLPQETHDFVLAITARPVEDWVKPQPADPAAPAAPDKPAVAEETCAQIIVAMRGATPAAAVGETPFAPWGVQLAGNFSKDLALAAFARERERYKEVLGDIEPFVLATRLRSRGARAFFRVRLPSPTRADAQQICRKLHLLGGSCIVLRS